MNIIEIRRKYLEKLEEKCASCFNNINSILVKSYNQVMNNKTVEIRKDYITSDFDSDPWREDVKKKIQEHYAGNWDVTVELRSHKKLDPEIWYVFLYKGNLHEAAPEVKKIEPVEEELVERVEILDL